MLPYQQRVIDERNDLEGKIGRLINFICSPTFSGLDAAEQTRLRRQSAAMATYSGLLAERIAAFTPE